jgi:hypothetical protein
MCRSPPHGCAVKATLGFGSGYLNAAEIKFMSMAGRKNLSAQLVCAPQLEEAEAAMQC